jgi:outer membrane protein assembly factor BamB
VIVQTVDNRLRALEIFDGSERWVTLQDAPALTMRGSSSPVLSGSDVVAGFDNGYLLAVDIESGDTTWQALLAPPSGRSDLERLSDIDGAIAIVGQDIYAAGYQGRIGSLAAESGQVLWSSEISSYVGVAVDWNALYTTQADGTVIALTRRTGAETWRQERLLRRQPTLPVPFHTTVVVGDFEGYLHFFNPLDGEQVARQKLGGASISVAPVVVANRLYVQSDSGTLAAYTVIEPERRPQPDVAEDEGA